jgi:hypothetical protein
MLVSQKLAIAAHLHVLLRRKTGRVTDTEWMAGNLEYALEIVRFSRVKAAEDGHPDLAEWADKLERAMLDDKPAAKQPLAQSAMQMLRERHAAQTPRQPVVAAPAAEPSASGFGHSVFGESGFADSTMLGPERVRKPREPNAPRYVGGIR